MPDSPTITLSLAHESGFDHALSVAGALAWPVVLLLVVVLFRAQIVALAHRVDELRWGDKSARFTRRLDRMERAAGPLPDESELALTGDHARFLQVLELSPAAAVLDAWSRVEQARARLVRQGRGDAALDRRTRAALADLAHLRDQAAHGHPVTIPDALRFRTLAKRAVNEINLL